MESCVRSLATPMSTYHGLSFTRCLLHVHSSGTPQRQTSSFPSCRRTFGWNTGTHTHHTPRAVSDWPVPVRSLSVRSSLNLSRHHRRHQQQQRTTAIQQLRSQHTRVQSACLVLVVKHNVCVGLRARLRRPRPVKHARQHGVPNQVRSTSKEMGLVCRQSLFQKRELLRVFFVHRR